MKDYFEVLKVQEDDSSQAIDSAFRNMLDKFPAKKYPEKNREIQEAYKVLIDPAARQSCLDFRHMTDASKQDYFEAEEAIIDARTPEAVKILEAALNREKHKNHLYYLLGVAYMGDGRPIKAVKAFEHVVDNYSGDVNLLIFYIKACLDSRKYRKAVEYSQKGFAADKDNYILLYCMVEGYMNIKMFKEAAAVLRESYDNPVFADNRYDMMSKLSYILFLNRQYNESLDCLEKLFGLSSDEEEILESGNMILEMLDFFVQSQMYTEAARCADSILKLLPERDDVAGLKKSIEKVIRLEPEFCRFEEDDYIPDPLKALIANEIFPEAATEMTEDQKKAYTVLIEYQILGDCNGYLMALRYMKNKYPGLYEAKMDFLDALQISNERKKLTNKNKALFYQYQNVIEELMNSWADEFDEDSEEDDDDYPDDEQ